MSVRVVNAEEAFSLKDNTDTGQLMLLAVPMFLTKKEISLSFNRILKKTHGGRRGQNAISSRQSKSQALYKLNPYKSIEAISRAIEIMGARRRGVLLKALTKDVHEEISSVSRLEKIGKLIVKGVERGSFPITK